MQLAQRQLAERLLELLQHLFGLGRAGRIDHQPAIPRGQPHIGQAPTYEGTRQQFGGHRLTHLLHLLAPRFIALHLLQLEQALIGILAHDGGRQQFLLHPQTQQPLSLHRHHQLTLIAARRHPAA